MSQKSTNTATPKLPSDLTFFASAPHTCGYIPEQTATTAFADPKAEMNTRTYSALAELGFRRSGSHVYTPHCHHCQACVPTRLPVANFQPNRKQRRTHNNTRMNVTATITTATFRDEQFALYQRYIAARHTGGGMDDSDPEKYMDFLTSDWSQTEFVEFRVDNQLIAVAVQDILTRGLSSVYTYFDPNFTGLSIGHYALLWQINEARQRNLPWLFLGYWISQCQKMNYKQEYRPIELFQNGSWRRFERHQALPT
ncbi:MAG: arginyltransferase [Ectothiorhodospiraceae bacterium]|nr:arginyltransferase [Ectothiorhodospiraceae bacterium]